MRLYLVRHAHASTRGPGLADKYRPLSERGEAQALAIRAYLRSKPITRVLSSSATRCAQTVQPLATAIGLEVEEYEELWEETLPVESLALLNEFSDQVVVACSHGNIIPEVLGLLRESGIKIRGRGCEKASIWELEHNGTKWTHANYVAATAISPPTPAS